MVQRLHEEEADNLAKAPEKEGLSIHDCLYAIHHQLSIPKWSPVDKPNIGS